MSTPYSKDNKTFSDMAHMAARNQVYPYLFNVDEEALAYEKQGEFEDDRWQALDGQMAIDRIVRVGVHGLRAPLIFTIQERFREKRWSEYKDITVTEWNHNSNIPSELYKITANLFLYGYYDIGTGKIVDAICINVPHLLMSIVQGTVMYQQRMNPRSNQSFLCFRFDALHDAQTVVYRMKQHDYRQMLF